jgi:hypothetical protein
MARGRGSGYKPRSKQRLKKIATGLAPRIPRSNGGVAAPTGPGGTYPPSQHPEVNGSIRKPALPATRKKNPLPAYGGRKPKKARRF